MTKDVQAAVDRLILALDVAEARDGYFHYKVDWQYQESEEIPAIDIRTVITALTDATERAEKAAADLQELRRLIASDAYAVVFQSLGQYRTALLKEDL